VVQVIVQALKILTIAAMALLVALGGFRVFNYAVDVARPAEAGEIVTFQVGPDETSSQVADRLVEAGLIRYSILFDGQMRLGGAPLEPGEYRLRKGMSADQIIDRITGEVVAEEPAAPASNPQAAPQTVQFVVPEGWRIAQMADLYASLGGEGGAEAFIAAVNGIDRSQFDFLAELPPEASLEGYLFPSTYDLQLNNPNLLVVTMLGAFGDMYTPEMRARTQQMGLNMHQVLTLASLVEKEAQVPTERPIIADVYISRLEQGWRLDADPTVQYAIGYRDDRWWPQLTGDDLFLDSPYNTYQVDGLPPGPIANPGYASIMAVLEPAETDYMYFVAKNDGSNEHAFAVTKEEQDANVELYLNN
jgi:UPF0755 protein